MNVLLIAIDTLRADHLGCYGYPRLTSPRIDRLASQGVRFANCFSPHIPTHPGFTTLHSGVDVMRHQIVAHGGKIEPGPAIPLLAELLRERGYFTASVDNLGRWFTRGFDAVLPYHWPTDPHVAWRKAEAVSAQALAALDLAAGQPRPWFLFLHYWDPHTPYLPPPPFDRLFYPGDPFDPSSHSMEPVFAFEPFRAYFAQWMGGVTDVTFPVAQYDAEIAYVDTALEPLFNRLSELRLEEETLVVLLADHGEVLDEHEGYFDHHGLYDANVHVPLILRLPGTLPAGRIVESFVQLFDVAPTVLDLIGAGDVAGRVGMTGRSALPLLDGAPGVETLFLTECTWMRKRGLRTGQWKLIRAMEPDFHGLPPVQLFDLATDSTEQRNLAAERPDVVAELTHRLDGWVERRRAETGQPDPLEEQEITLRRIGQMKTAVPSDQKLYAEGGRAE
ncbi:MAG TPA: sulfatase [Chloroflexota bacterium]|nr:sulfatase [Chloroflexota bacterium]